MFSKNGIYLACPVWQYYIAPAKEEGNVIVKLNKNFNKSSKNGADIHVCAQKSKYNEQRLREGCQLKQMFPY